jgi:DNA integrity scanning protein DisA with diadenylate cyclase activity
MRGSKTVATESKLKHGLDKLLMPGLSSLILQANEIIQKSKHLEDGNFWMVTRFHMAAHIVGASLDPKHRALAEKLGKEKALESILSLKKN